MTLSGEVQRRIGLPFMTDVLRKAGSAFPVLEGVSKEDFKYDRHSAFSIAVNHRDTFTGITDIDRATTIARLAAIAKEAVKRENGWAAHAFADEFRSPGHVPLLNAVEPLLEGRRGHTELTTALMIMAGLAPTATICEMMADDGRALSKEDAKAYARARNLAFLEGQDIVRAWRSWSV
jgi:3,4-dihydroxy 2-butanone 4-phosphate synthase